MARLTASTLVGFCRFLPVSVAAADAVAVSPLVLSAILSSYNWIGRPHAYSYPYYPQALLRPEGRRSSPYMPTQKSRSTRSGGRVDPTPPVQRRRRFAHDCPRRGRPPKVGLSRQRQEAPAPWGPPWQHVGPSEALPTHVQFEFAAFGLREAGLRSLGFRLSNYGADTEWLKGSCRLDWSSNPWPPSRRSLPGTS